MNINEFERTKPVVTMQKLNDLIKLIDEERVKTEILYRDECVVLMILVFFLKKQRRVL